MAEQLVTQVTQSQALAFKNVNKLSDIAKPTLLKPPLNLPFNSLNDSLDINNPNSPRYNNSNNTGLAFVDVEPAPGNTDHNINLNTIETDTKEAEEMTYTVPWKQDELLPPQSGSKKGKKCLILDLDETLVHSSFVPTEESDFKISVEIEGIVRTIYVSKRPHVDQFLKACGGLFEVVVFTASLSLYADPVLDLLDIHKVIEYRLFRESCTPYGGTYVKDLYRMGRPLNHLLIVDNSPHSYLFNPQNALPCVSWFDDRSDTELLDILEILKRLANPLVDNVMKELRTIMTSPVDVVPVQESVNESDEEVSGSADSENDGEQMVTDEQDQEAMD
jgi:RNA polymerase II subunit A small phosphatase-like protein